MNITRIFLPDRRQLCVKKNVIYLEIYDYNFKMKKKKIINNEILLI